MTEQEWLTSTDPVAMLPVITLPGSPIPGKRATMMVASDRKLRLFACAWRWAAGMPTPDEVEHSNPHLVSSPIDWAMALAGNTMISLDCRANLLREIFGNPFRPLPTFQRCVKDEAKTIGGNKTVKGHPDLTVYRLAQAAYEHRHEHTGQLDPVRLQVLADALEESGCTEETLLRHLRGEVQVPKHCKCGGEYRPLKKDTLPLLSQCGRCRDVGPFWADLLTWEAGGEKCERCYGQGHRYEADHDNGGGADLPCKKCGGTGRVEAAVHYRGCWVLDLLLGR